MPGLPADGPTVSMSFANNFWGKEDAGVHPLLDRMHSAKVTSDELKTFYSVRASIEEEYARKMIALCRKPLGSSESGSLRASLDVMRGEVESMGKAHQGIAGQMKTELEEPLSAFSGGLKERRKIVQNGIEKLLKSKQQQTSSVNKSRDRYEQDCLKIKGYLAQGHMVMGQEERKNKAKMEKTQIQLASTSNEYEAAVKVLEETTGRWNREWKGACDKFQDLEEERLDFTKNSLWTFANIASTVCVSDDASCEKIRLSLENCEVEKDISNFIAERGTGQEIPDPPRYIDFCRGDAEDNASVADEDNYSVAQFQRTMNPAFRTSSPQPSTFESHHDPGSDLAVRMGHTEHQTRQPSHSLNSSQISSRSQPAQLPNVDDIPIVPHNEYPAEGMTMLCRPGAGSDLSSAPSAYRPSSRESQSECSNPTTLSSVDPSSRQHSPAKPQFADSQPTYSPVKEIQKKRSGFFSNSPFRRKSKHEKEPPSFSTPTSRNTRDDSRRGADRNGVSPARPYDNNRSFRDTNSGSPEPVDPRAKFQLNVGNNVFDVDPPDTKPSRPPMKGIISPKKGGPGLDPIAAALEELKGVGKQSSVRMSADRYAGVATPGPGSQASTQTTSDAPPSYDRLGAPQPAFTSKQMKQTTQKYVNKTQDMYGTPRATNTRSVPRATSPRPIRSASPKPNEYQGRENRGLPRSASPNPYGASSRAQTWQTPDRSRYSQQQQGGSPNELVRASSPQPVRARQERERPHSSANMHMQLANGPSSQQQARGGSSSGGGGRGRPVSYYGGAGAGSGAGDAQAGRPRAKSVVDGRKFASGGQPILQTARALYMYRAAIPEELSFAKGDTLAVTRYQDDGWWEAEVMGKPGARLGLVPSNYLQPC